MKSGEIKLSWLCLLLVLYLVSSRINPNIPAVASTYAMGMKTVAHCTREHSSSCLLCSAPRWSQVLVSVPKTKFAFVKAEVSTRACVRGQCLRCFGSYCRWRRRRHCERAEVRDELWTKRWAGGVRSSQTSHFLIWWMVLIRSIIKPLWSWSEVAAAGRWLA